MVQLVKSVILVFQVKNARVNYMTYNYTIDGPHLWDVWLLTSDVANYYITGIEVAVMEVVATCITLFGLRVEKDN